jgi:glycerate 2-kinase
VSGRERAGPNQEYALTLAVALKEQAGIAALAAGTAGADGAPGAAGDPAGAIVDPGTLCRAAALDLVPATFLENNGAASFFRQTDSLIVCGPTGTNVNDFRAIVVDSSIGV